MTQKHRSMFIGTANLFHAATRSIVVIQPRRLALLASAVMLAACHSSTSTEPPPGVGGVPTVHQFYRLVAINSDTARVFPHDGSACPSAATKYQWGTLAFSPNGGLPNIPPYVTFGASWYPLCQVGIVGGGVGQSAAYYTQRGSALALTFLDLTAVTGRIGANGDTIALDDMPDFRGNPAWTNTAQFTYVVCTADSVAACR